MAEQTASTDQIPPTDQAAPQDLQGKIRTQVEFYFGSSNYPRDKFMKSQAALHPEGFIAISMIATFKKIEALSTDIAVIAEALKGSSKLKLSADEKMVKSAQEHAAHDRAQSEKRTVYAKGFPKDYTLEKAQKFFNKAGKVLCVRLRKADDGSFKGSLLVEFETEEIANAVLASPPKRKKGGDLIFQPLSVWSQEKYEQTQRRQQKYKDNKNKKGGNKPKKEGDAAAPAEGEGEGGDGDDNANKKRKHDEISFTHGVVLKLHGIGEDQSYQELKTLLGEYGEVAFVELKKEEESPIAIARFKTPEAAKKAQQEIETSKREIGGKVPKPSLLEGEEEQNFWKAVFNRPSKDGGRGGRGGRGGGRGGRGGRGGGRGFKKQRR